MEINLTRQEMGTIVDALEFYWAQTEEEERALEIAATMMTIEEALFKCGWSRLPAGYHIEEVTA